MKIGCPHCGAMGSGPRFVKRHFLDKLCVQHETDKKFTSKLAEGTRVVDDEEMHGKSEAWKSAARALRKKE